MARRKVMPQGEQDDSSREIIRQAAESVFAEKGFDGARVDEIARRAGVNSALLYYYYGSKENILHEIMVGALAETDGMVEKGFEQITTIDNMLLNYFIEELMDFLEQKKNILKITLIEILKSEKENFFFFELVKPVYAKVEEKMRQLGIDVSDRGLFLVEMFFTFTAPIVMYVILGDKWSEFHHMKKKQTRDKFVETIRSMITILFQANTESKDGA